MLKEEVDEDLGREKAEKIGALFKLTSAKTERNQINDFLKELLEEYIKKNGGHKEEAKGKVLDGSIDNSNDKKEKSKFKC